MSPSPEAHVTMLKNFVSRPPPRACISTRIQVFAGVSAFHEAMSSSNAKGTAVQSDVQTPLSKAMLDRP